MGNKKRATTYPHVKDPNLVGTYPALVGFGGGLVWDDVLEYRVWCYPESGAPDLEEGNDYCYVFEICEEAIDFSATNKGTGTPLALIIQEEFIDEPESGKYVHVKDQRLTEWPIAYLGMPNRTGNTIPDFLAANAHSRG
ncbi:MAG: GCN5 family acetyltransferase [Pedobacter sp.]|nr:MAG: GCN5 family acetyltransferase [Pedobacter sp.]